MFKKLIASLTFLLFLTFHPAYAVSTKSYQYDGNHHIIQITDHRVISIHYEYDNIGHQTKVIDD
ncbi:MAG: hypothetical protein K940chlam5_01358 [Candidatus Anoxychlamydiales bacterium]|nr:hypothetical protein [Candidatus Anoxychlamydiales bacterium]